jgi:hypothetical protein
MEFNINDDLLWITIGMIIGVVATLVALRGPTGRDGTPRWTRQAPGTDVRRYPGR